MSEEENRPFIFDMFDGVPERSKWHRIPCFPFCWKIDGERCIRIGVHKLRFLVSGPLALMSSGIFLMIKTTFPYLGSAWAWPKVMVWIFYCLGVPNLLWAAIVGPGYLPYYARMQKTEKFTSDDLKSCVAVKPDQVEHARKTKRPWRSCFSGKVGYFVLRADHYCEFLGSWIGYGNHRAFYSGLIFTASYLLVSAVMTGVTCLKSRNYWVLSINIFFFLMSGFYGIVMISQIVIQTNMIRHNLLILESLKGMGRAYDKQDKWENWEEVFGSRKYVLCWLFTCIPLQRKVDPWDYPPDPQVTQKTQGIFEMMDTTVTMEKAMC